MSWARAFGRETKFGWGYSARATDLNPEMFVPRGKIVGGSTAVNAQIFLRGVREDYDSWAAAGNDEWTYEKLVPYFERTEADPMHATTGPISLLRGTAMNDAARLPAYSRELASRGPRKEFLT